MFGQDCVENCSMKCGDPGVCDKVTGHCNGRCLPGWEGNMCQKGNYVYKIIFITLGYLLLNINAFRFMFNFELSYDLHVSACLYKIKINI